MQRYDIQFQRLWPVYRLILSLNVVFLPRLLPPFYYSFLIGKCTVIISGMRYSHKSKVYCLFLIYRRFSFLSNIFMVRPESSRNHFGVPLPTLANFPQGRTLKQNFDRTPLKMWQFLGAKAPLGLVMSSVQCPVSRSKSFKIALSCSILL